MQKLQDSVFSIVKTTSLSPAVFSFLQPPDDHEDVVPLGGILSDSRHGWLSLGPKFCVVNLKTGLKVAARIFGSSLSNSHTSVTSVVELPTPLTDNSKQLIISLQCDDVTGMICIFHINGSQLLQCIQTETVITQLAVNDGLPDGPLTCFDGVVMAGTKNGGVIVFDLNRANLIQALKNISKGYEDTIQNEENAANLSFVPLEAINELENLRDEALENDDLVAVLINESSFVDGQYIFRNPDGSARMKAKRDHIRVTVVQYIPQLGSIAVGYNFGAFQIWNLLNLKLEFSSQVNVECLPVTHFGFQEPCDDPRAFCYLWVIFSVLDRFEEEEFPLAVMYSLTYQGKRMLSDTKYLYQEFSMATIRFQIELGVLEDGMNLFAGKCISCHTYSVSSTLGSEGEDSMLNLCQLVWQCWGENANLSSQYGMLLFDLDQWYKDQMPSTYRLQSSAFMSATWCSELTRGQCRMLDARLDPVSVAPYCHTTRLEEHFFPNSLQYNCICLSTSEACILNTTGIQRQIITSMDEVGPTALLNPPRLYNACVTAGLTPLYQDPPRNASLDEQRSFLLSVALEARLSRFLKRCAHDWAAGAHATAGCTLPFLMDWCWARAIKLKENAKELTAPLFTSSSLPDRNVVRCLEHCVQQLTHLTGLLDAVLTKCCNLVVPDALSEMEEKFKGIGTVSLYFQVVQWFLRVGLLPERHDAYSALPYPASQLYSTYSKRRLKLHRLQDSSVKDDKSANKSCSLLYIDQLIEQEFGGDRIHQMWIKGGSECNGLYPPPSLYSLLRLYLLPDIPEEHKHSLVLYLLVDYSMVYDEVRYEAVIRRLMQFPTMFGLSNTAIKATQAFWHLDHRDFDFALDQLQCLTGNTLSEWQHNVVLSSLLAQKKTQAALQYLHVRKPAPIQNIIRDKDGDISLNYSNNRVNDHDKLEDWQSCCNLYLARGLVFEALDVIRMCVQNAGSVDDKMTVLNFFFKGCRITGQLSKLLQITLLPFEEEVFIKYLQNCNEPQTSDLLVMYYLQQARYLEAEQYNSKLKHSKSRPRDLSTSIESITEVIDRESARDTIVDVLCAALPSIANKVAQTVISCKDVEPHVIAPKPMSVYVQAKSPKNTFTYKSSFIQDTIENASETWMNKPKMRRGLKRMLNVEETPFICTPKLSRTRSIFSDQVTDTTPSKRPKLDLTGSPRTRRVGSAWKLSDKLSGQLATLLDMPDLHAPEYKLYESRAGTPHSILKTKRGGTVDREVSSPVDSRYLGDSDDEVLETASNHTHYSDANKHLRFTIPTASESGSTPSPVAVTATEPSSPILSHKDVREWERSTSQMREKEREISTESYITTTSHAMTETHPLESPPKKLATEENVHPRKSYKDTVKARRSLSISANSSLSEDPNTSIESIADIPITLVNPRYSGEKLLKYKQHIEIETEDVGEKKTDDSFERLEVPKTPKGRRGIRAGSESTPVVNRSRSGTPERVDSPLVTPLRSNRATRSRSRTPELSPRTSPLASIPEQPKQEVESEPHPEKTTLSVPRPRSRSRTPERLDKGVKESPRLEAIIESPTKSSNTASSSSSPSRRSLRSRSRTPEVEIIPEPVVTSPRSLRSRSKTPEKLMSPKGERSTRSKKPLSRLVLEANTFKSKEKAEAETNTESESVIECTPMKSSKNAPTLMDVTLSPIVNKSILQSSTDSVMSETLDKEKIADKSVGVGMKSLPAFTTLHETYVEKSVLRSYQSSIVETSVSIQEEKEVKITEKSTTNMDLKSLPAFTMNETDFDKSVLHSYESSVAEASSIQEDVDKSTKTDKPMAKSFKDFASMIETDFEKSVLHSYRSSMADSSQEINKDANVSSLITDDSDVQMKDDNTAKVIQKEKEKIVEIEREINEIEGDMSEDSSVHAEETDSDDEEIVEEEVEDESSDDSEEESASEDEEIISINDTDSDESSAPNNKLQIVEENSSEPLQKDEKQASESKKTETVERIIEIQVEGETATEKNQEIETESNKDQPNVSLMTDDNSALSDKSDVNLNYSDETKSDKEVKEAVKEITIPEDPLAAVQIEVTVEQVPTTEEPKSKETQLPKGMDVVDTQPSTTKDIAEAEESKKVESKKETEVAKQDEPKINVDTEAEKIAEEADTADKREKETGRPASRSRKRTKSTSSNQSTAEVEKSEKEAEKSEPPKTPMTRKRTQSTSNKSVTETEQKTPENVATEEVSTPSRRRAKTPTSAEVRKIITRRVSKEMASELDDSKSLLDESVLSTPKRRSARSKSKNLDDNASVASESSVKSTRSKASEDAGEVKAAPIRKGRKSILSTKPDLSVIPENAVEEGAKEKAEDVINEYSTSRRLTRHQKTMLESWSEPKPSPRRRASTASRASAISEQSHEDDDASSTHSAAFDVQPIDRISLLNKEDFDGPPDADELRDTASPDSFISEVSKRRVRMGRAASEAKSVPKAAKVTRRMSVDVGETPDRGSPAPTGGESPARGRRASFNRACEALHTPKGRRTSTDVKKGETDSQAASPVLSESESVSTPARRTRRAASTQSNTSQAKSETGKRSKKTEEKEGKK